MNYVNYLKLATVAILLLAVPSANAGRLQDLRNWLGAKKAAFMKRPHAKAELAGAGVLLGAGSVALYKYNNKVREVVDKVVGTTKTQAKAIVRDPKKRAIAVGTGLSVALLTAWKFGWLKVPSRTTAPEKGSAAAAIAEIGQPAKKKKK